jgi:hypothetical protein
MYSKKKKRNGGRLLISLFFVLLICHADALLLHETISCLCKHTSRVKINLCEDLRERFKSYNVAQLFPWPESPVLFLKSATLSCDLPVTAVISRALRYPLRIDLSSLRIFLLFSTP